MTDDDQERAAFEAWLNPGKHAGNVSAWVAPGRYEKDTHNLAWLAWCAARREPPDIRHPKIQALIGAKARREIELQLVEQLLDEGPDCDLTSLDMDYWHGLHDKLRDKLRDRLFASADERHLRRLLAVRVAMPHTYMDDGEAHGQEHGISIDFMRDRAADIDAKLRALNVARMECAAAPAA